MRISTLLAPGLLAAIALADDSSSSSSSTSSSSGSSSSSQSSASSSTPEPEPTPIGQLWTAKWKSSDLATYAKSCASKSTINAEIYNLSELYPTLKDFAPELKVFYHKQHYPGSWSGEDKHGNDRELMKMNMEDVPFAVREWIMKNEKQRHYNVHAEDGVVFFAPGAMYPILPLWVEGADDGKLGECDGIFEDLENYSNEPKDGAVIAKLSHKKTGKNAVEVTVEAMQVKKNKGEEQARDEL